MIDLNICLWGTLATRVKLREELGGSLGQESRAEVDLDLYRAVFTLSKHGLSMPAPVRTYRPPTRMAALIVCGFSPLRDAVVPTARSSGGRKGHYFLGLLGVPLSDG